MLDGWWKTKFKSKVKCKSKFINPLNHSSIHSKKYVKIPYTFIPLRGVK